MAAPVCVMVMGDAHLTKMDGIVYVKLAGVEQGVMLSWKWLVLITWIMTLVCVYYYIIYICDC